ncbi:hypothetical protein [Palleronia caenipelagi]|uniref:Uncharacterized protein n=1 Tax=Palleronia caenipelagi TaxID=2489174 RepID=A0A547PM86_9RHOB|nr:hypothetical protein [Palleronia caenipelagi]TRD15259.1 hypothetical protein FEV53_17205 [Palleronia caenipelagi]
MRRALILAALLASPALAQETASREAGLAAWESIAAAASHPRCANCHVEGDQPMWSGPSYGTTRPHGMNVYAGESRIGAEYLSCGTCHAYREEGANDAPHMAPQVADTWILPPPEMAWFGRSSAEICVQLSNPDLNGGRDVEALAEHVQESAFVNWGFNPGGGREPAPGSPEEMAELLRQWGAAGMPCPG